MGLLGLLSSSASNAVSLLYPSYATYKSISTNDVHQLERWLVYWCVIGAAIGIEGLVGWVLVWVPFYQEIRLAVVLWLVAPQTEGSTSIYRSYLAPFFVDHERDVDAVLGDVRYLLSGWVQRAFVWAWDQARERLNLAAFIPPPPDALATSTTPSQSSGDVPAAQQLAGFFEQDAPHVPIPPSLHSTHSAPATSASSSHQEPSSGAAKAFEFASSLLATYRPLAMAASRAHLAATESSTPSGSRPRSVSQDSDVGSPLAETSSSQHIPPIPFSSTSTARAPTNMTTAEVRRRRAQLKAELAALESPQSSGRDSPLSRSGYEEIRREDAADDDDDERVVRAERAGPRSPGGGWFGWPNVGSRTPSGYEKLAGKQD